ncbi:DUF6377 domain-containing protein [Flavobacterium sp. RHBU_3]|uniref:DUF6377 domain-containing protein n=1 Tax=Flavobacterium sp. RHBU_3 TaxID=3391184 RepID=UPI0039850042
MKGSVVFTVIFFVLSNALFAQDLKSAKTALDKALSEKDKYVNSKMQRIASYMDDLKQSEGTKTEYLTNQKLYEEYRKFKIDSAIYFVRRNVVLAEQLGITDFSYRAKIQLSNLYSSKGNYLEAQALLKSIPVKRLSNDLKALYYEFYSQFYEHYATNNPEDNYTKQIEIYRDSLLLVLNPDTPKYKINLAQKFMYKKEYKDAEKLLSGMAENSTQKDANYAMYVYLLGDINMVNKKFDDGIMYYSLAAATDIENGIKDHGAIQNLAIYYYYDGKIDLAYKYAQSALEDAVFCNVKFRTLMMSEFYSIINASYQKKEAQSRKQLEQYLYLISFLTLVLIVAVVYVYRQMRKVSKIKEALTVSGEQLKELNTELQHVNEQLSDFNSQLHESNRIKEEYIAQFFDICSAYIDKLDDYRKKLNKKAMNRQFDELSEILKSSSVIDDELNDLYRRFDIIFINLYPDFVKDLNALLLPDEQIEIKEGEILNTELRIFALERLGISDGVKIAAFLRYSVSTIYNYRTKIRNKAAIPREAFEQQIKTIG